MKCPQGIDSSYRHCVLMQKCCCQGSVVARKISFLKLGFFLVGKVSLFKNVGGERGLREFLNVLT